MSTSQDNLMAALRYAARGFAVFPCKPDGKAPLTTHGCLDATRDPDTIRSWWQRWPDANIAIATGAPSGIIVLDVDGMEGAESLTALIAEHGPLPDTAVVLTGGGGCHLYFKHPGGLRNAVKIGGWPGLDLRGDGGYVLAPPSVHPNGTRYTWESDDVPIAIPPDWLIALVAGNGRIIPPAKVAEPLPTRIVQGQRNSILTSLAGSMRRRGAPEEAILAALRVTNATRCNPPLPDDEVRRIAKSVARYVPAATAEHANLANNLSLTDLGNAERLVAGHGDDLRYCDAWGKWLVWDGGRWKIDDTGEVVRRAKLTVRAIYVEASRRADPQTRKAVARWALASESRARIDSMIALARTQDTVAVRPADFDADPWLLNCKNGTVDLSTGELRPHRRQDMLTKTTGIEYDPQAEAPLFLRFLERILPDPEVRRYVQKWSGYALTGVIREHRLPVWWGSGSNGKSTLIGALLGALGDYAKQMAPDILVVKQHDEHPTALADLFGARLVATIEVGEGKRLAEALVKQLTGGDRMKARFMRQDFFEWEPTHKIVLVCNHRPGVRGGDNGLWRRIDLVPFTVTIPEDEQDAELPEKLRSEYPGVLRWMVEGCLLWQAEGLGRPAAVREATEEYRTEMDVLGEFIAEQCVLKPSASVTVQDLYAAYTAWCEAEHEQPVSKKMFTQRLRDRGIASGRTPHHDARVYRGIGLRTDRTDADSISR